VGDPPVGQWPQVVRRENYFENARPQQSSEVDWSAARDGLLSPRSWEAAGARERIPPFLLSGHEFCLGDGAQAEMARSAPGRTTVIEEARAPVHAIGANR